MIGTIAKRAGIVCPFRAGDRVRLREGAVATFRIHADAMQRWRDRVGTVLNMGLVAGHGRRLYVRWDGNAAPAVWEICTLELQPDDWGVEPATTG